MLQKNLQALKTYYVDLHETLKTYNNEDIYKLEKKNDFYNISFQNKYIHSRYNPEVEAERWVDGLDVNDEDTISIIGLGLGYYLGPLTRKYSGKKIIIIEPSKEMFLHFLSIENVTSYIENKDIVFLVGKDTNTIRTLFDHYVQNNKINRVFYTELPIYKKIYINYIEEIYDEFKKILLLLHANLATEICFSRRWLYNTLRNLKYISNHNNISCIEDLMQGIPVVIVSAGPSLERNMHLLKGIYNKALIIAVGTAASILDSHGIEPHIIMGIDGAQAETNIFRSLKNRKPLFIYAQMIHFDAIEAYDGEKMWILPQGEKKLEHLFGKLDYKCPSIVSGGSIAHIALAFAHWLKTSPIILIGQDLAYSNDKLYASGSAHEEDYVSKESYIEQKDIYGNKIYTKTPFLTFKHWFEDYVKIKLGDTPIFNCTEGGLKIEGIPNILFKEAIELHCSKSHNIKEKIKNALSKNATISDILIDKKFSEYKDQLESCMELSEIRLKKVIDVLDKELYSNEKFSDQMNDIFKITADIEEIELYNIFIENTGKMYYEAITRSTNQEIAAIDDVEEKRRIILQGLLRQYNFANENLMVAKAAIEEEEEVLGLFN